MSDVGLGVQPNGKEGISGPTSKQEEPDKKQKFIIIDDKGWVTGRIHLDQGLYNIVGFLKEVEDNVRYFYTKMKKEEQEKLKIVKPGFRGFNMFKK